jgi:hypothetical protein
MITGSVFTIDEVVAMSPDDIQRNQAFGFLPKTKDLKKEMELQSPGVLEMISEELQEFFESQEKLEKKSDIEPEEVTNQDQKLQETRFRDAEHSQTLEEQVLLDRGLAFRDVKKSTRYQPGVRGKYPRSGGVKGRYR